MQPVKKFIMKEDPKHIRISEFNYPLPDERIAKFPLPVRDQSKLLVYRHGEVSEDRFTSLPSYLPTGSLMIFNNTKVIQARLHFRKETGALIEVFCLEPIEPNDYVLNFQQTEHAAWLCMIGNLKKWKEGTLKREMTVKEQPITLTATRGECHGTSHWVDFRWDNPEITFADILEVFGELPIPPYLNRDTQESDKETYQTVYSKIKGSVAAPTAGLHFTPRVLNALKEKGVDLEELTLHVGAGTFKPVKSAEIEGHEMHTEYISVSRGTIENLIAHNGKAIAVGTTSVRTLESLYHIGVTLLKNPNATEEEMWKALRMASAETFIRNLPQGLDTVIGERGHGLSEGQAQRIAIARAFVRKAPFLILDEATSALDEDTEMAVIQGLQELTPRPTCLVITHRKSILQYCDREIKIENKKASDL